MSLAYKMKLVWLKAEYIQDVYIVFGTQRVKVKLGDQDKPWAPHKVGKQCLESIWMWTKGTHEKMPLVSLWFARAKRSFQTTFVQ